MIDRNEWKERRTRPSAGVAEAAVARAEVPEVGIVARRVLRLHNEFIVHGWCPNTTALLRGRSRRWRERPQPPLGLWHDTSTKLGHYLVHGTKDGNGSGT